MRLYSFFFRLGLSALRSLQFRGIGAAGVGRQDEYDVAGCVECGCGEVFDGGKLRGVRVGAVILVV